MAQKPRIPKGTRDFSPEEVAKRNYIFDVIKQNFERFGFQPIETPSFELSETLMGKYGEEGDRLIFKILNSGDYLKDLRKNLSSTGVLINNFFIMIDGFMLKKDVPNRYEDILKEGLEIFFSNSADNRDIVRTFFTERKSEIIASYEKFENFSVAERVYEKQSIFVSFFEGYVNKAVLDSNESSKYLSEKALRYDLTVPFARYVVQHQNEIDFPFKRYQIQPVWRADRPQKGRFREFYQCDADVVGSKSLLQEIEFVQLYDNVFSDLNLEGVTIKLNNRKILSGIADVIGAQDKLIDFTVALDKLDKIGEEKVKEEMRTKGISEAGISRLQPLFSISGSFQDRINSLKGILSTSEEGLKGIEDIEFIYNTITDIGLKTAILELDVTLARGLNYYTGAIFEVAPPNTVKMGSIGGGGRYDDLTGIFGLKDMSGIGISFGLDRIYLVLEELNAFPTTVTNIVKTLFVNFGDTEALYCLKAIKALRNAGISAELYPDAIKMGKQMNYANKRDISFVTIVGDQEVANNTYVLKNMSSGEQSSLTLEELIDNLS